MLKERRKRLGQYNSNKKLSMDSTPADTTYISHTPHTHTHTHTHTQSKPNDVIYT